jgi:hypothetical protein
MTKHGTGVENRRRFLLAGSAAVVTPFLPVPSVAQQHDLHGPTDFVQQELRRQLYQHTQQLYRRGRAEDARALAATLRVAAAHGKGKQIDAEVQRALRRAIAKQGRQAILLQLDQIPPALQAESKALGVEIPAQVPLSVPEREAALEHLLKYGVTPQWEQAASMLETAAAAFEGRGPVQRVRFQTTRSADDTCGSFRLIEQRLGAAMRISCGLAFLGPLAADLCAAAFGAWAGAYLSTCVYCGC